MLRYMCFAPCGVGRYTYLQGAADDEETWAGSLTAPLFWAHSEQLLNLPPEQCAFQVKTVCRNAKAESKRRLDEELKQSEQQQVTAGQDTLFTTSRAEHPGGVLGEDAAFVPFNFIYSTGVAVGGRRAGRPPQCWRDFDAVLNMTLEEYKNTTPPHGKVYLHLPVAEGKKDRRGLEQQLAPALHFAYPVLAQGKTLLVHCNQGADRSVAVAIAILATFYSTSMALLPEHTVVAASLATRSGTDWTVLRLLKHVACQGIDKHALQRCHQHVMQARPHASPTRHTLKKLNRFFMSHKDA